MSSARLRVKICGITNPDDARICVEEGADALGFIFYKKSPRYIDPKAAGKIIKNLPPFVTPVGIFVNEPRSVIDETIQTTGIRIIQLSGDEVASACTGYSVKVWKAFRFTDENETSCLRNYKVAAALLDGVRGKLYGGTGALANFDVARAMKSFHPLVLAGGLNPANIVEAIESVRPYAVDINSGVESSPGKKDPAKVAALFEQIASHFK